MNLLNFKKPASFGLDIGHSTVKMVQIRNKNTKKIVTGYGYNSFKPTAIVDGEVMDFDELQKCIENLLAEGLTGTIDSRNVVLSVPSTYVFIRVVTMPKVSNKDLEETVLLEAEQYIPTSISELYLDHEVIAESSDQMEVLVVAAPRKIIDSYVKLFTKLNIKIASIESSMDSTIRVLRNSNVNPGSALVIDLGSVKSNLAVLDNSVRVTGYTSFGGVQITKHIAETLKTTPKKSELIKTKEGLNKGKHKAKIEKAIEPILTNLSQEVRRMIAYYNKRHPSKDDIENIILVGGSSKMPGLAEYIEKKLKIPTILCDPWVYLSFEKVKPPEESSNGIFATSVGLALANYEKAYKIKNEVSIDEDIIEENIDSEDEEPEEAQADASENELDSESEANDKEKTTVEDVFGEDNKKPEETPEIITKKAKDKTTLADIETGLDKASPAKKESSPKIDTPKTKTAAKKAVKGGAEGGSQIKTGKSRFK